MKKYSLSVLFLVALTSLNAFASIPTTNSAGVPISLQTVILKKVLIADSRIANRSNGVIIVVYDAETEQQADIVIKALSQQGLRSEKTNAIESLNGHNVNAIYYVTDNVIRPKFITDDGILTFSSNAEAVEQGKAAISIRYNNNKPEVVVNKGVLIAEGHAEILNSIPKAVIY